LEWYGTADKHFYGTIAFNNGIRFFFGINYHYVLFDLKNREREKGEKTERQTDCKTYQYQEL
jgi:hypothetical protein